MFLLLKIILLLSVITATHTFVVEQSIKVRFCVEIKSLEKCQALGDALRIENSRVDLNCVSDTNCIKVVSDGSADVLVVNSNNYDHPDAVKQLDPALFESYNETNLIVALIDADQENKLDELPLFFESKDDLRLKNAALYIDHHSNYPRCVRTVGSSEQNHVIHLERFNRIKDTKNKKLVCIQDNYLVVKPISEYKNCNVEANIPNAVMVKKGSSYKNEITQAFIIAVNKLGHGPKFELFGPFRGQSNLIFSDETKSLVPNHAIPNGISVGKFFSLPCGKLAKFSKN